MHTQKTGRGLQHGQARLKDLYSQARHCAMSELLSLLRQCCLQKLAPGLTGCLGPAGAEVEQMLQHRLVG